MYQYFLFMAKLYSDLWVYPIHDGYLVCFHFLTIRNNVAINIQVSVGVYVFSSPGYIRRSGIAGPHGNVIFNISGNCQSVF